MAMLLILGRLLLVFVFAIAGVAKLSDRKGSRRALREFGLPESLTRPLGTLLPIGELATAALLAVPSTTIVGGGLALTFLVVFTVAIASTLTRGRSPDCHCFGQLHSSPVGWRTLVRNVALTVIAALVAFNVEARGAQQAVLPLVGSLVHGDAGRLLSTFALGLTVVQTFLTYHLLRQHGRLLIRLDNVE